MFDTIGNFFGDLTITAITALLSFIFINPIALVMSSLITAILGFFLWRAYRKDDHRINPTKAVTFAIALTIVIFNGLNFFNSASKEKESRHVTQITAPTKSLAEQNWATITSGSPEHPTNLKINNVSDSVVENMRIFNDGPQLALNYDSAPKALDKIGSGVKNLKFWGEETVKADCIFLIAKEYAVVKRCTSTKTDEIFISEPERVNFSLANDGEVTMLLTKEKTSVSWFLTKS